MCPSNSSGAPLYQVPTAEWCGPSGQRSDICLCSKNESPSAAVVRVLTEAIRPELTGRKAAADPSVPLR
jgi:hypothetical protein